jgi:hypothetical protein
MRCLKTGFDAQLLNHGMYLHGDAYLQPTDIFKMSDFGSEADLTTNKHALVLRISDFSFKSDASKFHILIDEEDHWFDKVPLMHGTMMIRPRKWRWLGYDGTFSEAFGTFLTLGINPEHE